MVTRARAAHYYRERDLIKRAADKARREASQGQSDNAIGRGPIVPVERYKFVGLLDELALAAGAGTLPDGVRRLAIEIAEAVLAETDQ